MTLTPKDIILDPKMTKHAFNIFKAAIAECVGEKIGAWEVFYSINLMAMLHIEAGMKRGMSREEFSMVKKKAQVDFITKWSRRPDLWKVKTADK